MKKSVPDRQYTDEFRETAVKQVVDGGRAIRQVARSLEMSAGTLGNWVAKANKGQALSKRLSGAPVNELESEVSRRGTDEIDAGRAIDLRGHGLDLAPQRPLVRIK